MKLAVLGPSGTYTCIASEQLKSKYELELYPSIFKSILAIDDSTDALIPLENTLDGFVFEGLDAITKYGYHIVELPHWYNYQAIWIGSNYHYQPLRLVC